MPESMHFHVELVGDTLHPSLIDFFQTEALNRFRMEIGVQSFQDKTLQAVGRMCNLDKLSDVISGFSKVKAHQHTDLIAGLPYESLELFKESYQKLIHLKPFEIQVGILKLLHGTVLHQLKDIYHYQAEKLAPYQITQSKWMSYDDIKQVEYVAKATEKCYNSQRLKEEFDLIFEDSTLCAFDIMAECGKALSVLKHPYQVIEFNRTLSSILEKYDSKARFYIEKAYYRQAKLKPTLIFPMNSTNLNLYREYLSHYTEMSHKAIWIEEENCIYAIIYQKDMQLWFELNRQGELIRETSISNTK